MADTDQQQRLRGHAVGALDNAASDISRARDYLRDLPGRKPTARLERALAELDRARDEIGGNV